MGKFPSPHWKILVPRALPCCPIKRKLLFWYGICQVGEPSGIAKLLGNILNSCCKHFNLSQILVLLYYGRFFYFNFWILNVIEKEGKTKKFVQNFSFCKNIFFTSDTLYISKSAILSPLVELWNKLLIILCLGFYL